MIILVINSNIIALPYTCVWLLRFRFRCWARGSCCLEAAGGAADDSDDNDDEDDDDDGGEGTPVKASSDINGDKVLRGLCFDEVVLL